MKADGVDVSRHSALFFNICFIILLLLGLYVIRNFIVAIVGALVLGYIFYPLYEKILYVVRSRDIASLLTAILVIVIIMVPLIFAANALINESLQFFYGIKNLDMSRFDDQLSEFFNRRLEFADYISDFLNKLSLNVARWTSAFLVSLPSRILSFFVMLFTLFYVFKGGKDIVLKGANYIPLRDNLRVDIVRKFSGVVYASLYGLVVTAFVQGSLGAIGLWIFNVPSPILWGAVMVVMAMLPFFGAWLIWFPAAVYKLLTSQLFDGIGLLIFGLLVVSTIDNIIRPKIIGMRAQIHPVLVLLGVLGGMQVFGLMGIIIGPLILAMLTVFAEVFLLERMGNREH